MPQLGALAVLACSLLSGPVLSEGSHDIQLRGLKHHNLSFVNELKHDLIVREHRPFRERLRRLLPGDEDGYVTVADVAAVEAEILSFNIPRITVVDLNAGYVPVSWQGGDSNNDLNPCPQCVLRLKKRNQIEKVYTADTLDPSSLSEDVLSNLAAADVQVNVACPSSGKTPFFCKKLWLRLLRPSPVCCAYCLQQS